MSIAGDVIGSVVSAGAGLYGAHESEKANRENVERQAAYQKEFAKHGIQWRVEDAKAAGVHPLYAIGAQTQGYSPIAIEDRMGEAIAEAGQDIGGAVRRSMDAGARARIALDERLTESQIGENEARTLLLNAERGKVLSEMTVSKGVPAIVPESGQYGDALTGAVQVNPAEVPSTQAGAPERSAGVMPYYQTIQLGPGFSLDAPMMQGESIEEVIEAMSAPAYGGMLLHNMNKYGLSWLPKYTAWRFGGVSPEKGRQWRPWPFGKGDPFEIK